MIKLRAIAATSALGLSMGLALLGTGVASAHGPIYNVNNVRVAVSQNVDSNNQGYGSYWGGDCGCYYGYGYGARFFNVGYGFGWGWPWGW